MYITMQNIDNFMTPQNENLVMEFRNHEESATPICMVQIKEERCKVTTKMTR